MTWVCRSGGRSLTTCGPIVDQSVCYTDDNTGIRYCGMVKVELDVGFGTCARLGDSGGPVFARHRAYGIATGAIISNCILLFEPIARAQDNRRVDVSIDQG